MQRRRRSLGIGGQARGYDAQPICPGQEVGTGFDNLRVSFLPFATAPASVVALPSIIFRAPTMSRKSLARPDSIAGSRTRSVARAKASAVTGLPSEKRASLRIVNV